MKSGLVKRVLSIILIAVLLSSNVMPVMAKPDGQFRPGRPGWGEDVEESSEEESEEESVAESEEESVVESEESSVAESEEESVEESADEESAEEETTVEETTEEETTEEETTEEEATEIIDEDVPLGGEIEDADGKVSVTIEHYLGDESQPLFVSDEVEVDNGGTISGFAKGYGEVENENGEIETKYYYEVARVECSEGVSYSDNKLSINFNVEEPEEEAEDVEAEEDATEAEETLSAVVKVFYNPTTDAEDKRYKNEVAFVDYVDGPGVQTEWWGNNPVPDNYSINSANNYAADSTSENRLATKGAASKYQLYVNPTNGIRTSQYSGGKNANEYCGDSSSTPIIKGLLAGVSENGKGDVDFTYDDPGFFSQEQKIGKEILDGYELKFERTGVEYNLNSVLLDGTEVLGKNRLNDFFPLPVSQEEESRYSSNNRINKNQFFGMRYDFDFTISDYIGAMDYTFTGDDDLWVCMDGNVILDLGGIHQEYPRVYGEKDYAKNSVDLWDILLGDEENTIDNRTDYVKAHKGEEHHITVIYMERGGVKSNCTMNFTMPNIKGSEANITANPRADLTFTKVDKNDSSKKLEGAVFKLYNKKDLEAVEGQEIDYSSVRAKKATSDANGVVRFEKLRIGEYVLREISAPAGYMRTATEWTVKVEQTGEIAVATLYRGSTAITTIENIEATHALSQNKEAELVNWDKRTYKINLEASSLLNQEVFTGPVDITLSIDVSASMLCPASLTSVGTKTVTELDKNRMYYYIDGIGTKAVWCDDNQWKALETSSWEYGKLPSEQWERLVTFLNEGETKEFFVSDDYSSVLLDATKTVNEYDRMHAMKDSVKNFVDDVAKISPESTIGIVVFGAVNGDKTGPEEICNKEVIGLTSLDASGISSIKNAVDGIVVSPRGATFTNKGLALASEQIATGTVDAENRFVVLITDGEPNCGLLPGSSFATVDEEIGYYASEIKKIASLVTMGIGIDGNERAKSLMNTIASCDDDSNPYAYTVTQADGMGGMLQLIGNTILSMVPVENATIVDYIDERFEVTDADGNLLSAGAKVLDNFGNEGTLYNENGKWYVKWTNVTIPSSTNNQAGWFAEIYVIAKEDFMGGNMVATNGTDSGISFEGTSVPFDKPSVNVKLRDLAIENGEITLFKGETITPTDYLAELNDTVEVTIADEAVALASAPVLTEAQKTQLITNKTLSVPYSYANDEIGAFEYTVVTDFDLEDHEAVTVGNNVENYTLKVVYKANSLEERKAGAPEGLEEPNTVEGTKSFDGVEVTETNTAEGIYKVNVVAGSLVINKIIDVADIDFAHGDPIFTFKVMKDGEFFSYHTVRFTQGTDGKMSVDGDVLSELPKGVYTVEELDTVRYEQKSVTANGVGTYAADATVSGKKAQFGIGRSIEKEDTVLNHRDGEVTFTNAKEKELNFSDTDVAVNTFTIGEDGSISWVRKNTPGIE